MRELLDVLELSSIVSGIVAMIFLVAFIIGRILDLFCSGNDGHVSFAAGGLLAACALDTWIIVSEPRLLWLWIALFAVIFALYRWYGAWLRTQDARRHRHVFDTLRDEEAGFAVLACKCGAPYCLVRIVR